jgi:hypothetical protein
MCAPQSAANRRRISGVRNSAINCGALPHRKPARPAKTAHTAITNNKTPIIGSSSRTESRGRAPARAAIANGIPSKAPTHHVAMTPHPNPRTVGECVLCRIGGWKTVKYSKHIRAVIWSCTIPYITAAKIHAPIIFTDCIARDSAFQRTSSDLFDQRIRVALVLGDLRRKTGDGAIVQVLAGFLEQAIA